MKQEIVVLRGPHGAIATIDFMPFFKFLFVGNVARNDRPHFLRDRPHILQ